MFKLYLVKIGCKNYSVVATDLLIAIDLAKNEFIASLESIEKELANRVDSLVQEAKEEHIIDIVQEL